MDVCEDANSPLRNLEEARRDEGVSCSWEDELSKTLNMEPLGVGGGGAGTEPLTWVGHHIVTFPSGGPWSTWNSWVPEGRYCEHRKAGSWECSVEEDWRQQTAR